MKKAPKLFSLGPNATFLGSSLSKHMTANTNFDSFNTPARDYAKGIGDAVADRTINRKLDPVTRQELPTLAYGVKDDRPFVREVWSEVALRVAKGNSLLAKPEDQGHEFHKLHHHLRQASILMSGRHLQHGDENQPNRNLEVYSNCSTSASTSILFYLLLNGSGVGRSYDDLMMAVDYNHQPIVIPTIDMSHPDCISGAISALDLRNVQHMYTNRKITVFEVPDSREGWSEALMKIETATFQGRREEVLVLDFSKVRPRGAPIKGMQNRPASGPEPLMSAISNIARLRDAGMAPWRAAMYADHYVAECVLVGGARRAARMATKYWKDASIFDFIQLKRGGFLWSSNNSVLVDEEFWTYVKSTELDWAFHDDNTFEWFDHAKKVFQALTEAAYFDNTGEPGLINVDKLEWNPHGVEILRDGNFAGSSRMRLDQDMTELNKALVARWEQSGYKVITNPCVAGDTIIDHNCMLVKIKDRVGVPTNIWNGEEYSEVVPFSTGINSTLVVKFSNHKSLTCTHTHKFLMKDGSRKEAIDLEVGDEIADYGFWIGLYFSRHEGVKVSSIEPGPLQETFCVTEPLKNTCTFNGVLTGNCGEVVLNQLGGYCVIADVVPYHASSDDDAEDSFRTAARALIRTNTMEALYQAEVTRTNRIGIGMTGIHEYAWARFGFGWKDLVQEQVSKPFWLMLSRFKRAIDDECKTYAEVLGVSVPHTNSTEKPSGTTSKLFGLTEGAHLPAMREYLRWVQFRNDDPLIEDYKARGYPTRELRTYSGTTIVGFPTSPAICTLGMGDKLVTAAEATPEEQYQYLRLLEKYWIVGVEEDGVTPLKTHTGNQVSYTLKFYPNQVSFEEFQRTLIEGQSTVRCCSVMPQIDGTAFEYQPEEPLTKHQYESIAASIVEEAKEDVGFEHVDCASGACPISFNSDATA